jgi:hypothetical protein
MGQNAKYLAESKAGAGSEVAPVRLSWHRIVAITYIRNIDSITNLSLIERFFSNGRFQPAQEHNKVNKAQLNNSRKNAKK